MLRLLDWIQHPSTFATKWGNETRLGCTLRIPANQSDALGRPMGRSRVHVVDASSLPSIPATTITFSVMANAHRIGTLCP